MKKRSKKVDALLAIAGGCAALVGVGGSTLGCPVATKYGGPPMPPPDPSAKPPEEVQPAPPAPAEPTAPAVKYGGPTSVPQTPVISTKYGGPRT